MCFFFIIKKKKTNIYRMKQKYSKKYMFFIIKHTCTNILQLDFTLTLLSTVLMFC